MKATGIAHHAPIRVRTPYYVFSIRTTTNTLPITIPVSHCVLAIQELDYYVNNRISMIAWDTEASIGKQLHDYQYINSNIALGYTIFYYDEYGASMKAVPTYDIT